MSNFKMRILTYFIVLTLTACEQSKVKVIADTYQNGKPKTVRYFKSTADSKEVFTVKYNNGEGTATKPITFVEEGYYQNGKLEFRGQYINGKTSGLWEYFYETGIPEAKSYYDSIGKQTDTVHCWYESGNKKRDIVEIDKTKNYWHNIDYYETGAKHIECYQTKDTSDNFKLNGLFREWYDNGQLKFIATLKDSWTVGKWQEYELNGKLKEESEKPFSITIE
jgi:antitoxin component YwqK of YwqJK toxin-antitoxin module